MPVVGPDGAVWVAQISPPSPPMSSPGEAAAIGEYPGTSVPPRISMSQSTSHICRRGSLLAHPLEHRAHNESPPIDCRGSGLDYGVGVLSL
jgi:hypothetical protein